MKNLQLMFAYLKLFFLFFFAVCNPLPLASIDRRFIAKIKNQKNKISSIKKKNNPITSTPIDVIPCTCIVATEPNILNY